MACHSSATASDRALLSAGPDEHLRARLARHGAVDPGHHHARDRAALGQEPVQAPGVVGHSAAFAAREASARAAARHSRSGVAGASSAG